MSQRVQRQPVSQHCSKTDETEQITAGIKASIRVSFANPFLVESARRCHPLRCVVVTFTVGALHQRSIRALALAGSQEEPLFGRRNASEFVPPLH